jgi:hypothetical protein
MLVFIIFIGNLQLLDFIDCLPLHYVQQTHPQLFVPAVVLFVLSFKTPTYQSFKTRLHILFSQIYISIRKLMIMKRQLFLPLNPVFQCSFKCVLELIKTICHLVLILLFTYVSHFDQVASIVSLMMLPVRLCPDKAKIFHVFHRTCILNLIAVHSIW